MQRDVIKTVRLTADECAKIESLFPGKRYSSIVREAIQLLVERQTAKQ